MRVGPTAVQAGYGMWQRRLVYTPDPMASAPIPSASRHDRLSMPSSRGDCFLFCFFVYFPNFFKELSWGFYSFFYQRTHPPPWPWNWKNSEMWKIRLKKERSGFKGHPSVGNIRKNRDWLNPFRTPVPFWGQITWNQNGLSPNRNCGTKGVNIRVFRCHDSCFCFPSGVVWKSKIAIMSGHDTERSCVVLL